MTVSRMSRQREIWSLSDSLRWIDQWKREQKRREAAAIKAI